jgi:phenylacetate-CoA ligase
MTNSIRDERHMALDREALEDIYNRVPIWFQNGALSAYGLHTRLTRYNKTFFRELDALRERDTWSAEQTIAYRDGRIRQFIQHCADTVPYYRGLFRDLKINPPEITGLDTLSLLPVLDRATVRDRWREFISDAFPASVQQIKFTSGTSGAGLRYISTLASTREQWAVWWRFRYAHGIQFGTECAMFRSALLVPLDRTEPPFWRRNHATREMFFSGNHMSPRYLPSYIEEMNRRRPPWIHGFGSTVTTLASFILESGLKLDYPVRWITLGSEQVYPHQVEKIEAAFGIRPLQIYGMTEAVANASEAPDGVLYVDEDFAATEFLPADESGTCDVVGTNLSNPIFPLVRYRVGDLAVPTDGQSANGRRIVSRLDGRSDDYIIRPDGSRLGRLDILFRRMVNIREAQILQQRPGEVRLRVAKGNDFTAADEAALLSVARKHLGGDMDIQVDYVDAIERTPSGKLLHVRSELARGRI